MNIINITALHKKIDRYALTIVISVSLLTSFIVYSYGVMDMGFPYTNIAVSTIIDKNGSFIHNETWPFLNIGDLNKVGNERSSRLVVVLLPVFLHHLTNIDYTELLFIPLTGVLLPILSFMIVKRLTNSNFYGLITGIYISLETLSLIRNYNINIQGYGFLFYFMLIFSCISYLKSNPKNRNLLICIIIIYMGVTFAYYSAEIYSLLYISSFVFISLINNIYNKKNNKSLSLTLFFIILIVTLIIEDRWIIGKIEFSTRAGGTISEVITTRINNAINRLVDQDYTYTKIGTPTHLLYLNISLICLIIFPLLMIILKINLLSRTILIFSISIIITFIISSILYSSISNEMDLKILYSVMPLATISIMRYINKRFSYLVITLIIIIIIIRFLLYTEEWDTFNKRFLEYKYLSNILLSNTKYINSKGELVEATFIISDDRGAGKLLFMSAYNGRLDLICDQYKSFDSVKVFYDARQEYLDLLKATYKSSYFIINKYTLINEFPAQGRLYFKPFSAMHNVFNIPSSNRLYDGYDAFLFQIQIR